MMSAPTRTIGKLVITPRPLSDYRNMFLLTDEELTAGPILDCPGGGSPFGAQVRARGGTVVSVDPSYAMPRDELLAQIRSDMDWLRPWMEANSDLLDWSYLGSPDVMLRAWEVAVDLFFHDFEPDGERYVAASLPSLPFPDKHFSLALSSHLLFAHPNVLNYEAHLAAILELIRVTDGDVRLFPLCDSASVRYPRLEELCDELLRHGVRTEIRKAAGAYNAGCDEFLVCWAV